MKINAFTVSDPLKALKSCDGVTYCGEAVFSDARITAVAPCGTVGGDIYLPSMCDEDMLGEACDYVMSENKRMIVRAAYDMDEAGIIEAKYKLSPIMLLHKLGALEYCTVLGGVCLDNDDLDLMSQEGVPLILTPTASAGYGHGYAPVCAAVKRGLRIGIGTFDNKYNRNADIAYEAEFMSITANADMRTENALTADDIAKILGFE